MLKRRLKLLGRILLGIVLLFAAFLLVERWRGQIALASFKKQLLANGEKLSPEDFVQKFNPEDNGAPGIISAVTNLAGGMVLPGSYPPNRSVLPSGRAVVGFLEPHWVEKGMFRGDQWVNELITNQWSGVAEDLQPNDALLAEIKMLLKRPVLNNGMNHAEPLKFQFLHLGPAKTSVSWFGARAQLALREGRSADALEDLVAGISLPRLLETDHVVISELVRFAMASIMGNYTWEALQYDHWTDADLATLQRAWEQLTFSTNTVRSLAGERVFISESTRVLRQSNAATYDLMFGPYAGFLADEDPNDSAWIRKLESLPWGEEALALWRKQIYCRVWRFAWSHQAELRHLRNMTEVVNLADTAANSRSYRAIEPEWDFLLKRVGEKGFYDRLRFPPPESVTSVGRTIEKAMRAETERSLVLAAIALKRYQLRQGKYPERLQALTPEFLTAVPVDFMDGQPVKYQRLDETSFVLYSVGEDGRDDGGDVRPPTSSPARDLWQRRDYVWPAPATPEEVEEFRREAGKN
jgi:hypothetical protein